MHRKLDIGGGADAVLRHKTNKALIVRANNARRVGTSKIVGLPNVLGGGQDPAFIIERRGNAARVSVAWKRTYSAHRKAVQDRYGRYATYDRYGLPVFD